MIQRIQSIFLILAALALSALFKYPVAESSGSASPLFEDQAFTVSDHPVLTGLTVIAALTCFISVFLFRNRVLQLRITKVAMIACLFLGIVAVWLVYSNASSWSNELSVNDSAGLYLTIAGFIMTIFAGVFIKKDENTVRSMDRLR